MPSAKSDLTNRLKVIHDHMDRLMDTMNNGHFGLIHVQVEAAIKFICTRSDKHIYT